MHSVVFARVVDDNRIEEYPLTYQDINNLNNPLNVYYPCVYSDTASPLLPSLAEKIVEVARVIGNTVYVERSLVYKTVDDLFNELRQLTGVSSGPILNTDISPEVFAAFKTVIKIKVSSDLDAFAKTRGYDNIQSLCNYYTSSIPTYQSEAIRGIQLQDQCWSSLFNYFHEVQAGAQPIPLSWSEMSHLLPELTWEAP
jgi:hypothetical protein